MRQVLPLFDLSLREYVDRVSDSLGPLGRLALARSVCIQFIIM